MINGRATGECFVVLESQEDIDNAKIFIKKILVVVCIYKFNNLE